MNRVEFVSSSVAEVIEGADEAQEKKPRNLKKEKK